ncbi:MAG: hypothetical protein WCF96_07395 [Eubacteriales bacterium]
MLFNKTFKDKTSYLRELALPIVISVLLLLFLVFGLNEARNSADKEGYSYLQNAINRASIECYAVEGMYAPNIAYLENHYGLIIDHKKYIVHYEAFASNIMPDITVIDLSGMGSDN